MNSIKTLEVVIILVAQTFIWSNSVQSNELDDLTSAKSCYESEDYLCSLSIFNTLASSGNIDAFYYLGLMNLHGQGLIQDYDQASKLFLHAANLGHTHSQYQLGLLCEKNEPARKKLLASAADFSDLDPEFVIRRELKALGLSDTTISKYILQTGNIAAHMWFNLAVSKSPKGQFRDTALRARNRVEKEMSMYEIKRAQSMAKEWLSNYIQNQTHN